MIKYKYLETLKKVNGDVYGYKVELENGTYTMVHKDDLKEDLVKKNVEVFGLTLDKGKNIVESTIEGIDFILFVLMSYKNVHKGDIVGACTFNPSGNYTCAISKVSETEIQIKQVASSAGGSEDRWSKEMLSYYTRILIKNNCASIVTKVYEAEEYHGGMRGKDWSDIRDDEVVRGENIPLTKDNITKYSFVFNRNNYKGYDKLPIWGAK